MKKRGVNRKISDMLVRTVGLLLVLCTVSLPAAADGQVIQGERVKVLSVSGGATKIQRANQFGWSGAAQLWWTGAKPGDKLVLELPVAKAGKYNLVAQFSRAVDYGIVQLSLDGKRLGAPIDLYAPRVVVKAMLLGKRTLAAGSHRLTVEIVGANPLSVKAYMFGLDYWQFDDPNRTAAELSGDKRKANPSLADRLGVDEIIFAVRRRSRDGHWYANIARNVYGTTKYYGDGGRLSRWNVRTGKVVHLVDDPRGGVRDPQMHYDGKKILFSYRKGGSEYYHLCEINLDGTGLKQLTGGPYDDIEPAYLPDGGIIFPSTRCNGWVPCGYYITMVLFRCNGQGKSIRKLSSNITPENTPWVLPDGRVLYMRWEYVNRNQVSFQHLWTINPDGTGSMVYYGNQFRGGVYLDAKPIPKTRKVVFVDSPGHGRADHAGTLATVDHRAGPDSRKLLTHFNNGGNCYDPYPLSHDRFLYTDGRGILLTDGKGSTETLYTLPGDVPGSMFLQEPRPVRSRPREDMIPSRVDLTKTTGTLFLSDVYQGRNMRGVKRGEIKKLLVLEQLQRPAAFFHGQLPFSLGGTFTLKRIIGEVPVEPDGSACFEAPAMRSLFFVALDENNMSVKHMQSFVTLQPGEVTGCFGCHERRTKTTRSRTARRLAARQEPRRITPIAAAPEVFDFPRDIQPILDKHCVACHKPEKRKGKISLVADRNEWFSESYTALIMNDQISDGNNKEGDRPPRTVGSSASRLMKTIDGSHYKVKLSAREYRKIQLWIEGGANYAGTAGAGGTGEVAVDRGKINRVFAKRCSRCHKRGTNSLGWRMPPYRHYDHAVRHDLHLYNLTHPARSWLLLAPLAKRAGGNGVCRESSAPAKAKPVFADKNDPDYRTLLTTIDSASGNLNKIKRYDMPGFRPHPAYVRQLKRFGVLPKSFDPQKDPLDCFQADEAYYRSLWHRVVRP